MSLEYILILSHVTVTMRFYAICFCLKHKGSMTCYHNFVKEESSEFCPLFIKGVNNPLNSETE